MSSESGKTNQSARRSQANFTIGGIVLVIFVMIAGILQLCGCEPKDNRQTYEKGCIELLGGIVDEKVKYHKLQIGNAAEPLYAMADIPEIYIEKLNGELISLKEVTAEYLQRNADTTIPANELNGWPPNTTNFKFTERASFKVSEDGRILGLTCGALWTKDGFLEPSVLWNSGKTKRYVFPLNHKEAIELFGQPDKVKKGFQW
ncbi:hypothetical protein STSP2_00151 [Anaerohalosphaera lusitana]|uniref:Uncharacterized protein n=1 Tax=Anaerohalosphaera lusitana TaxID=1936003 RepID=A0A1U9NGF6_9BACT|nr:hypothetical protein [Anaerohalosphaera lusitana]AQT67013.1 hypothetical protein STSP2_00151 [Anaerohalosphaera lusitana]